MAARKPRNKRRIFSYGGIRAVAMTANLKMGMARLVDTVRAYY